MRRTALILLTVLTLAGYGLLACGDRTEPAPESTTEREPSVMYEMSELAALMEVMSDSLERWKTHIETGGTIGHFPESFRTIHTAQATDGFEVEDDFFQTMSTSYLDAVDSLATATPANVAERYDLVVANCISCHQVKCPGPLERIETYTIGAL